MFDMRRPSAHKGSWSQAPAAEMTVALSVYDALSEEQLCRQHLDLANAGQNGPVWHSSAWGRRKRDIV